MISQKSIQQVLDISQVEDIIQDYVNLRRAGVNLLGLCPFHDEKTPSFSVSPSKNIYKCFGCGKGGGPVQFLMEHDGLSFPEAIRNLAKRYNIELEETQNNDPEYQKEKQLNESLIIINEYAKDYFEKQLWDTNDGKAIALSYFKERGFRENIIRKFQLGYASKSYDQFTKTAVQKKYNIEHLRTVGLTTSRDLDFFKDRVMFTIWNVTGKPIAFAGRTLRTDKKTPKYINSPETPVYNKRKILYAIHLAKSSIRKEDVCYMTEGYTDVISLHQGGIENVVASSGTSLTKDQVRLVKRYTNNITFLYDGDAAGINAAMRGLDIVLAQGMNVKLVVLPEGEDPDSYISKVGKEGFKEYINTEAKDFILFKTDTIIKETSNDPVKRGAMLKDIIVSLSNVRDPLTRSFYLQDCSQKLQIQEAILVKEVNKQIRENIRQEKLEKDREARRKERTDPPPPQAQYSDQAPFPEQAPLPTSEEEESWIQEDISIVHKKQIIKERNDEYQERDLARITVSMGDEIMDQDGESLSVASFIYSSIFDVKDYFDRPVYQKIIQEAFELVEKGQFSKQYFVNHEDEEVRKVSVEFLSSKYQFANWETHQIGLFQISPEKNYYEDSYQAILRFKFRKIKKIITQLEARIIDLQSGDDAEALDLNLKAYRKLQEDRKELAKQLRTIIG